MPKPPSIPLQTQDQLIAHLRQIELLGTLLIAWGNSTEPAELKASEIAEAAELITGQADALRQLLNVDQR